jgi:hypothetical protein
MQHSCNEFTWQLILPDYTVELGALLGRRLNCTTFQSFSISFCIIMISVDESVSVGRHESCLV